MVKRVWKVVHPLLTLAAVGCCVYLLLRPTAPVPSPSVATSGRASEEADRALRQFLNVRWIGGDAELPSEVEHCAYVLFTYADGHLASHLTSGVFSPNGGSRVIPMMAMWGPTLQGYRGTTGIYVNVANPVWEKLDGQLSRSFGARHEGEVHGFRIFGYACSRECQPGWERARDVMGESAADAIKRRRHVLLLGYKPFATEEEARKYVNGDGMDADFRK